MKNKSLIIIAKLCLFSFTLCLLLTGCTAPRSMMDSGKVTPKHQLKIGASYSANVPTQTIKNATELIHTGIEAVKLINTSDNSKKNAEVAIRTLNNSPEFSDEGKKLTQYLLAYSIDPLTYGINYYARYGLLKRVDVGYQYAGGTNAFDAKYQFLGSTGSIGSSDGKKLYGSIGIQYSAKNYSLPSWLGKVQDHVGFEMKRKDVFVPIIFSKSFGQEEKTGHFSWGLAYNYTFLEYGFNPKQGSAISQIDFPYSSMHYKKHFSSYGAFVNVKVGYKYVYFLASLSVYYQDYGKFTMLDGSQSHFSGFTYVPSMGVQFVIPPLHKIKK